MKEVTPVLHNGVANGGHHLTVNGFVTDNGGYVNAGIVNELTNGYVNEDHINGYVNTARTVPIVAR